MHWTKNIYNDHFIVSSFIESSLKWNKPGRDNYKITWAPGEDWSSWTCAKSVQSLHCPQEEGFGPLLPIRRITKTLITCGCQGWSESSFGACMSFCWFCRASVDFVCRKVAIIYLFHWDSGSTSFIYFTFTNCTMCLRSLQGPLTENVKSALDLYLLVYRESYTSGHFIWNLWNEPSASFINFIWNDHECKILFIIWRF